MMYVSGASSWSVMGSRVKVGAANGFRPIGHWLATPDEIDDVGQLAIWLEVNGHRY
jgi:2,4-diketo-3-deoxy-L-fuconate hydrolase